MVIVCAVLPLTITVLVPESTYPEAVTLFIVWLPPERLLNVTCPDAFVVCAVPSTVTVAPDIAVPDAFCTVIVRFPAEYVIGTQVPF